MPTFMESCCCAGRRPEGVVSRHHVSRADLVARLLRDRRVARFVVAPTGFGKSCLAFEYANMVFSFQHVFWVNGRSPCFLRDLDAAALLPALHRLDGEARLVVFEDVPRLDADRAHTFGELVDSLLDRRVEVIITCVPSADSFPLLQRDRVLLRGRDLLLGDEEMAREALEGRLSDERLATASEPDRIAGLRWGAQGARLLLQGVKREELPGSIRLAMLVLLVVRRGHADDLMGFLPADLAHEALSLLAASYLFLGIDERTFSFRAAPIDLEVVAEAFSSGLDEMASASLHEGRDGLCAALADLLLTRHETQRACSFMMAFATKHGAAQWIARCGWVIISRGEPVSFCSLRTSVVRSAAGVNDRLSALGAWAAFALGDAASAAAQARRVVRSGTASELDRVRAAVLLARVGSAEALERMVADQIVPSAETPSQVAGRRVGSLVDAEAPAFDWALAAQVAHALSKGALWGLVAWEDLRRGCGSAEPERRDEAEDALMMTAAWVLGACADADDDVLCAHAGRPPGASHADSDATPDATPGSSPPIERVVGKLEALAGFTGETLAHVCHDGAVGWHAVEAALALERLCSTRPRYAAYLPDSGTMACIRRGDADLLAQRDVYRRQVVAQKQKRQEYQLTHPDVFRRDDASSSPDAVARTGTPMLNVTLFGGVEVRVGEQILDARAFGRQKTRTLLALLVLNRGREISRERLALLLWPESDFDIAKRNLYTVWSQLRRAIAIEGNCPYLIRSQSGLRLDMRLVTSDAFAFESLCRSLLFGSPESEDWERLYSLISTSYGEDLMPCEEANEVVDALRSRYRMQLVDGMIAASKRLLLQGEPRGSLWFARAALDRDRTREDAYVTLMEAQIGADQRGAALDTYFACRRFLTEELGIDPSPYIVNLYRSIIETEEPFA